MRAPALRGGLLDEPLSEDRTGLADTVPARSEAQVLRLSMLYALLDCTHIIRHEHIDAALACGSTARKVPRISLAMP